MRLAMVLEDPSTELKRRRWGKRVVVFEMEEYMRWSKKMKRIARLDMEKISRDSLRASLTTE